MSTTPRATPTELQIAADKVEARLEELFADERDRWRTVDERLSEAIDELARLTQTGGKRIRAAFCYWSYVAANGSNEKAAIDAAAACEMLQTFALIHDDIMDDAATRRGQQTIHVRQADRLNTMGWNGEARRFGEGVAILVGDLGHVYADRLMHGTSNDTRAIWDELRIELNLGQYLDMRSSAANDTDRLTAERIALFKSALYTIVRPLQLGASVAGVTDRQTLELLDHFGRPIGAAFQLRDDLLGVLSTEDQLGKPVGGDLREGKSTELLAIALENATPSQLSLLARIGSADLGDGDIADVVSILNETGAVAAVESKIAQLVDRAEVAVRCLPYEHEHQQALMNLGRYVATRTY